MPHPIRIFLGIIAFTIFFVGSLVIGVVLFPMILVASLGNLQRFKGRCTRFVGRGYGTFLFCLRLWGLITWTERLHLPAELEGRPYVLVANHPSLIDVLFLLHWLPGSTSVVKSAWRNNVFFGPILRSVHYVSNAEPGDEPFTGALMRMVDHVEAGHPLIIFPEGTRSLTNKLHRFKRGAFEVAVRTGVPILPVFIGVDPPTLKKGTPLDTHEAGGWFFEMMPIVETAGETDSRTLRNRVEADFQARFEEWATSVGREVETKKLPSPSTEALAGAANHDLSLKADVQGSKN
ncbi:MAG: 1-acyl-sn-glycerol-3-phosphate acyltransferase [Polyangiales bacterium]|jgi:1-acyl-sn-glycerol-3-phosphate acyltransferase